MMLPTADVTKSKMGFIQLPSDAKLLSVKPRKYYIQRGQSQLSQESLNTMFEWIRMQEELKR